MTLHQATKRKGNLRKFFWIKGKIRIMLSENVYNNHIIILITLSDVGYRVLWMRSHQWITLKLCVSGDPTERPHPFDVIKLLLCMYFQK